jgi:hypothetical protein
MIPPDAQRAMSKHAGATVIEARGSHAIYESKPAAVASLIEKAAMAKNYAETPTLLEGLGASGLAFSLGLPAAAMVDGKRVFRRDQPAGSTVPSLANALELNA